MADVELREYTKRELKELLADEHFWAQPRLPITKRRIVSQISNPRADDDDVVLITAFNRGQLVAYLGILPDLLMNESQTAGKFGWLTAWWADKESGSRLAATTILFAAMKKYSNRLAASSPSSDAVRVYDATKRFQEYARFDVSYFVLALPPAYPVVSPLTRWAAGAKNRLMFRRTPKKRGLEIQVLHSLEGPVESFINRWAIGDPLARDTSYWRWVLEFPWIAASAEEEAAQRVFAFSVFAKEFRQIPLLITRHGTIIGFLVMTFRDGRLSLKYAYYDLADTVDVAIALQAAIADVNPWMFVCADAALSRAFGQGLPLHVARRSKTSAVYAAKALSLVGGPRTQFGTGDTIFA